MKSETLKLIERKLKRIKKGCGIKVGVPFFRKFRPCGSDKSYFCENCQAQENQFKWLMRWLKSQEKELNKFCEKK